MCDHTFLDRDDGMPCVRDEPHTQGRGCVYQSSSGSDVPDRHDATSGGEH